MRSFPKIEKEKKIIEVICFSEKVTAVFSYPVMLLISKN